MMRIIRAGRRLEIRINPDKWTPIGKRIRWRCCGCGKIHRIKFKVVKNEIYIKEWKEEEGCPGKRLRRKEVSTIKER